MFRSIYITENEKKGKVKVYHSLVATGAVGARVSLYLGDSI